MNSFDNLKKTFLIAEIGNNHEGSYKNAIKLIDKAKASGVDAVKFQTFDTNNFINKLEKKDFQSLKALNFQKKILKNCIYIQKKKDLNLFQHHLILRAQNFYQK